MIPNLRGININGEILGIFTFYDSSNRNPLVTEYHEKVTKYFNIPVNYIPIDYRMINHGGAIETILKQYGENFQYLIFWDNDFIPLRGDVIHVIYEKIKDKRTIFGCAQNSSHKNENHPFPGPSSFSISSELYKKLGQPHLGDIIPRSDTTEEATWKAQELGYNICLVYPSHFHPLTDEEIAISGNPRYWRLGHENIKFGLGTTYGDMFFHAFMQSLPRSAELFITKCKEVLGLKQGFTYHDIKGWCDFEQIYEEMVNKFPDGSKFVELGTFLGKSSALMGKLIKDKNKKIDFYTVDSFVNTTNEKVYKDDFDRNNNNIFSQFRENMEKCGISEYVKPLIGKTSEMADKFEDKSLDFIFVDAAHDYEGAKLDLQKWYPKLKDTGVISGHDAADYAPGEIRALNELFGIRWKLYSDKSSVWIVRPEKKIEAIIVSRTYGDYLKVTLPENKKYFDNIIVVTDEFDGLTQKICEDNGVEFVIYDGFNKNGAKFNFGGARQFGLNYSKFKDYICFLDCDCIIREDFRNKLTDINKFYGSYRRFIPTYKHYKDLLEGNLNKENFLSIEGSGCGFFSVINLKSYIVNKYGINNLYKDSFSAEQVDIDHLKLFCPLIENDKNLIRMNIELWHLGDKPGLNNNGRSELDNFFKI